MAANVDDRVNKSSRVFAEVNGDPRSRDASANKPSRKAPPSASAGDKYRAAAKPTAAVPIPEQKTGSEDQQKRFTAVIADAVSLDDEPDYLVQFMIPQGPSLTVIVGKDKSGKSFLISDVFFHIAMGRPYLGCDVQQGAVVYISNEGERGIRKRIVAMRRHYGVEGQGVPFYHIKDVVDLGQRASVDELIARVQQAIPAPIVAIGVDPLMNAMPGLSDSEGKDVGIVAANCHHLATAFNTALVIGHHAPRADEGRSRGSNVLDGRADAMWSVVKADGVSTVTVYRMKDGPEGLTWQFRLEPFDLEPDRRQKPRSTVVTAGISLPTFAGEGAGTAGNLQRRPLNANQQRFFAITKSAIADAGETGTNSSLVPVGARAITREMLKRYCVTRGWLEEGTTETECKRARSKVSKMLNTLAGKNRIGTTKEYVWLIGTAGTAGNAQEKVGR